MNVGMLRAVASAVLAVIALAGFAWLHVSAIVGALAKPPANVLPTAAPTVYIATALTGLVTAVVASCLGVPVPTQASNVKRGFMLRAAPIARTLGVTPKSAVTIHRAPLVLAWAYVGVYIACGSAAIVTFVRSTAPQEYTSALAMVFIGVVVASVQSFVLQGK